MELLQKASNEFRFDVDWDFELNVQHRGVSKLPNYYFRDDGLELWTTIKNYVERVINIFYLHDDDILQDNELQDWMSEIIR